MASLLAELEVLTIMFSLLVFALFTLTGMLNEECARCNGSSIICFPGEAHRSGLDVLRTAVVTPQTMDAPFSGFELTFIIIAFIVFSLFILASVCFQPQAAHPGVYEAKKSRPARRKQRVIVKQASWAP